LCQLDAPLVVLYKQWPRFLHVLVHVSRHIFVYRFVYPTEIFGQWNNPIYPYRYQYRVSDKFRYFYKYIIYQMGRQEPYPPTYLIIYVLLHRLGEIAVNHFNQLYRVTAGV
jgi:hypothetical protein